ncbi:hypothetical protein Gotur_035458 [Gossypium turneri]
MVVYNDQFRERNMHRDGDTGLGWNPIKRTVDASDDWWESRL